MSTKDKSKITNGHTAGAVVNCPWHGLTVLFCPSSKTGARTEKYSLALYSVDCIISKVQHGQTRTDLPEEEHPLDAIPPSSFVVMWHTPTLALSLFTPIAIEETAGVGSFLQRPCRSEILPAVEEGNGSEGKTRRRDAAHTLQD